MVVDNLQVYCNTLHVEVHELYSRLHPDIPADPVGMGVGPSGTVGEALGGELDLFKQQTVKQPKTINTRVV
jgi:hypothetical protein